MELICFTLCCKTESKDEGITFLLLSGAIIYQEQVPSHIAFCHICRMLSINSQCAIGNLQKAAKLGSGDLHY